MIQHAFLAGVVSLGYRSIPAEGGWAGGWAQGPNLDMSQKDYRIIRGTHLGPEPYDDSYRPTGRKGQMVAYMAPQATPTQQAPRKAQLPPMIDTRPEWMQPDKPYGVAEPDADADALRKRTGTKGHIPAYKPPQATPEYGVNQLPFMQTDPEWETFQAVQRYARSMKGPNLGSQTLGQVDVITFNVAADIMVKWDQAAKAIDYAWAVLDRFPNFAAEIESAAAGLAALIEKALSLRENPEALHVISIANGVVGSGVSASVPSSAMQAFGAYVAAASAAYNAALPLESIPEPQQPVVPPPGKKPPTDIAPDTSTNALYIVGALATVAVIAVISA